MTLWFGALKSALWDVFKGMPFILGLGNLPTCPAASPTPSNIYRAATTLLISLTSTIWWCIPSPSALHFSISNLSAIIRISEGRLLWQLVLWKSALQITRAIALMLLYLLHNMHLLCQDAKVYSKMRGIVWSTHLALPSLPQMTFEEFYVHIKLSQSADCEVKKKKSKWRVYDFIISAYTILQRRA